MFNLDNITVKMIIKTGHIENNIIDKIYFYTKDLEELKYQLLFEKREQAEMKNLEDKNAFIEHSNTIDDIYHDIND